MRDGVTRTRPEAANYGQVGRACLTDYRLLAYANKKKEKDQDREIGRGSGRGRASKRENNIILI